MRTHDCFLLDPSAEWLQEAMQDLWGNRLRVVGVAQEKGEALEQIAVLRPEVIILGEAFRDAIPAVADKSPGAMVFMTASNPTPEAYRTALSAGARRLFGRAVASDEVCAAIDEVLAEDTRKLAELRSSPFPTAAPVSPGGAVARQRVISVWSPKGGAGKTTIAINLAAALASQSAEGLKVCLVDGDPDFGDIAPSLAVAARRTLADWADAREEAKRNPAEFLAQHGNLFVLPAPLRTTDESKISGVVMHEVLEVLRRSFDMIVVDLGTDLRRDSTIIALEGATDIIIVGLPHLPTLLELDMAKDALQLLNLDTSKIKLVLNRVPKGDDMAKEAREHLPWPLIGILPDDQEVLKSANNGEAVVLSRPDSLFATAARRLGEKFAPAQRRAKAGLLGRLLGRATA